MKARRGGQPLWPYKLSSERTVNDCFSCFDLSTVFQMDKELIVLYTQDIWREKWRTSVLMGLRSIPNCQSATCT